jgi:putative PIN family toxin of toxin-antitoxin system
MIRVVIDTSVLVSAVISPAGPNAQLFDFIVSKEIRPYVTDAVLEEYSRVFGYERLKHLDKRRTARLIGIMERVAVKVKSPGRLKISGHGDDDGTAAVLVAA